MYRFISPLMALITALVISLLLLAGAHAFEHIGGLAPCLLCLEQREVHWTAAGVGVISVIASRIFPSERVLSAGLGAMALVFIFSAWLSGFHAGVEWGFWPGPDACAGGAPKDAVSGEDLLASLDSPGPVGPACSVAMWRLFGISMAGYNAIISLGLAGLCAGACYAAWRMGFSRSASEGSAT